MAPSGPPAAKAKPEAKAAPKAKPVKKEKKEEAEERPRMERPDRQALDDAIAKIQEDIEKLKGKQQALSEQLNSKKGGNEVFNAKKAELMNQRNEFNGKIDALMAQKESINGTINEKRAEGQAMKQDLTKMKKSIGFTSEAEIDKRIQEIEYKMHTESHSLKDEQKFIKEISELKRNRPKVAGIKTMEANVAGFDPRMDMKENIAAINAEVSALRDGRRTIQEALSELMEGRKAEMGDMGPVIQQKEEISKKIQEKMAERNTLRDEFRAKTDEYRKYMDEVRAERQKKYVEEKEARDKEYEIIKRQRAVEKLDEQPHIEKITLIEQTMAFCKTLTASKGPEEKEEKKAAVYDAPEGAEVMVKKEDRDEFWFAPLKAKGKKGKTAKKESGSAKPIKHNAETFKLFDQLKLDAPITTDDIPAILEKLEAQLADYNGKVKEWEEKREEMKKKILDGIEVLEAEKEGGEAEKTEE